MLRKRTSMRELIDVKCFRFFIFQGNLVSLYFVEDKLRFGITFKQA